jgi:hypothetical protein
MKTSIIGVAVAALFSMAGCTQAPAPVPDTREADAKAIRETAWNQDWAAKDLDKIVSHYADDANLEIADTPYPSDQPRSGASGLPSSWGERSDFR